MRLRHLVPQKGWMREEVELGVIVLTHNRKCGHIVSNKGPLRGKSHQTVPCRYRMLNQGKE